MDNWLNSYRHFAIWAVKAFIPKDGVAVSIKVMDDAESQWDWRRDYYNPTNRLKMN